MCLLEKSVLSLFGKEFGVGGHVFVAAAGEIEDYEVVRREATERACLKWTLRSFGPLRVPQDDSLLTAGHLAKMGRSMLRPYNR